MIRARTDEETKEKVERIFAELGLNTSQAINIFFKNVIMNDGMPFAIKIPNKITRETFEATDRGEGIHRCKNAEELFRELGI